MIHSDSCLSVVFSCRCSCRTSTVPDSNVQTCDGTPHGIGEGVWNSICLVPCSVWVCFKTPNGIGCLTASLESQPKRGSQKTTPAYSFDTHTHIPTPNGSQLPNFGGVFPSISTNTSAECPLFLQWTPLPPTVVRADEPTQGGAAHCGRQDLQAQHAGAP